MASRNPIHSLIDDFSDEFKRVALLLIPAIRKKIDKGVPPEKAVKDVFKDQKVILAIETSIAAKMVEAAAIGYGVDTVAKPEKLGQFFFKNFKISEQIASTNLQGIIAQEIRTAFRKQMTYVRIATELEGKNLIKADLPKWLDKYTNSTRRNLSDRQIKKELISAGKRLDRMAQNGAPNKRLKTAYSELVTKSLKGSQKQLDKSIQIAIQEKARYNAERIARTEIARSQGMAHDFKVLNDPDVIGTRYRLSTRHRIYDICDFHTSANLYGMGKGVYPKEKHPSFPFHPHCTCNMEEVYIDEAEKGPYNPKAGNDFIDSQSRDQKKALLGVKGSSKYKNSGRWQSHMRNWQGHEDVSTNGLKKSMFI